MKTFSARGASLFIRLWHFFPYISMESRTVHETHILMVKITCKRAVGKDSTKAVKYICFDRNFEIKKNHSSKSSKVTQFLEKWQFYYRFTVSGNL